MRPHKEIPIESCGFFRLGTKRDLAKLLGYSVSDLKQFAKDECYTEWPKRGKNGKIRIIEQPSPELGRLQKRVHKLIRKVETPPWLMSGKRGISSQDNALVHCESPFVINVDIEKFFQSTKREFVFLCFQREFQIRSDVASLLADLLTYKGHIPTGTSTSQLMAFWAYKKTFLRICRLCEENDIVMSLWVDDITFSRSSPFSKNWVKSISHILKTVDLQLKINKTKKYSARDYKIVTGSGISPDGLLVVRNEKRKEILGLLGSRRVEDLPAREARSLFGKLTSQRQNDPDFFSPMYRRCRAHLSKKN